MNIVNNPKKKKGKKSSPQVKCLDAQTEYDPPTIENYNCRLCHVAMDNETPPASHLLTCDDLPTHAMTLRNTFFQQQSKLNGIHPEALANQTALFLTTHTLDDPDPTYAKTTKDYLIGQLFTTAMDEFENVEKYHDAVCMLIRNLSSATLRHLKFDPKSTLHNLYYRPGIDPILDDDDPTDLLHHPLDLLDEYPEYEESIDDLSESYDYDEF